MKKLWIVLIPLLVLSAGASLLLSANAAGAKGLRHLEASRSGLPPGAGDAGGDDEGQEQVVSFAEHFGADPFSLPHTVVSGQAAARLSWQVDAPAFPGDVPGSLRAVYDARLPAGWFGFSLPVSWSAEDTFSAAAVFVIDSQGFFADPNGFFQISWGLWNSAATGLERTGNPTSFATDTYELVEFDYFPNVSPFFGGPFVSPSVFGAEVGGSAFNNFTGLFDIERALPLDVPLLALLEHRPDLDALVVSVHRIVDSEHVVPLNGVVGVVPLASLSLREYEVDTLGLTLWNDGFAGPAPSVLATLHFHALAATAGLVGRPESMLALAGAVDPGGSDDEDEDEDDD